MGPICYVSLFNTKKFMVVETAVRTRLTVYLDDCLKRRCCTVSCSPVQFNLFFTCHDAKGTCQSKKLSNLINPFREITHDIGSFYRLRLCQYNSSTKFAHQLLVNSRIHSKNRSYFQVPFLVLQLVTNRGLISLHEMTNQYLEGPQQEYHGPSNIGQANSPILVLPGTS